MKLEQLEKLLDAGFTKDEIFTLIGEHPTPETSDQPTPVITPPANETTETPETPTPETPESKPETTPPETINTEIENRLAGIEKGFTDLVKAVQISNLKNDSFGSSPDSLEEQTDRIMKSIIRPEIEKKEG